jgi:Kef-type K+ transport system membrane component KefB
VDIVRPLGAAASSNIMPLVLAIAVLIVAAKVMAALSTWLGQPAILSEIPALGKPGPTVLSLFAKPTFPGHVPGW